MINLRLLVPVVLLFVGCAALGIHRLDMDTDVIHSLPSGDRTLTDAVQILAHHPIHDQVAVDITANSGSPDVLAEAAMFLEKRMRASGLFVRVGMDGMEALIPGLAAHVARSLPLLFSRQELEQKVAPLLSGQRVRARLRELYARLGRLEGIGQAGFIGLDPLGLRELVLARLAPLAPTGRAVIYRRHLLSPDGRHLLVTARPRAPGTDTVSAQRIAALFDAVVKELSARYRGEGIDVRLTPVGAYRATLDNERLIRHDVRFALIVATLGIGLLLVLSFPRPLLGILSLVPALAGTAAALLVYSLFHDSISIMVLGFGSAIISITVDHGITYLLFLDRPIQTRGREAAWEVRAIGVMAVVTSIGAFLILAGSGFPIFTELGQFAALGIFFSFLFVHTVFPRIFPVMPAAAGRSLPLRRLVNVLGSAGWPGAVAAVLLACCLAFFAVPRFQVDLESMNTVSAATREADLLFTRVWGDLGDRIIMMHSADSAATLQAENDRLLEMVEQDLRSGRLAAAFVPSMLFPGKLAADRNRAAWRDFWTPERRRQLRGLLLAGAEEVGFAQGAFAGFLALLDSPGSVQPVPVPPRYYPLLGISAEGTGSGLAQFVTARPGQAYDPAAFRARYREMERIFDGRYFSRRLADVLFSTFTTLLWIIAAGLTLLLVLFYLDITLTLLTLLPVGFAYVCTLGTLHLLGRPLDIPALMLSVIILGMGVDYSIYSVRAWQRYRDMRHPASELVRCGIFLSGVSTLIGFGVLCFADHSLLRSIGITSLLGIGYSLAGAFLLLPPLLNRYFSDQGPRQASAGSRKSVEQRVRARYRTLEAYPRMFARCKLWFDPMFRDLPRMLALAPPRVETILDIGCGYGVPACWCLEFLPGSRLYGLDPDPERVRVAAIAGGTRAHVHCGRAPAIPVVTGGAELILVLDMLHYLDDAAVEELLAGCVRVLSAGGILVARFVIRPGAAPSLAWRLEDLRVRWAGGQAWYRAPEALAAMVTAAGFKVVLREVSTGNPELVWLVARK